MARRDSLLTFLETKDIAVLNQLTQELPANQLADVLTSCSHRQLQNVWDGLQTVFVELLQADPVDLQGTSEVMDCVVKLARGTLKAQESYELFLPPALIEVAILLHGLLPTLTSEVRLQEAISRLCEHWWHLQGQGKEELIKNTLTYLLEKSTGPKATKADVSRLFMVCPALTAENLDQLETMLLHSCTLPQFVDSNQGIRFLAHVFTLDPELTKKLHQAIKNHLVATPRTWHIKYCEIYFRAWQAATTPVIKEVLEQQCFQDMMYRAVHASRTGPTSLAKILFKMLSFLHSKKTCKGVESMLTQLYEPILWRSLMVANCDVRINAAKLMFDVFPLQDTEHNRQESDEALQKQFDVMHSLLSDPVPEVRLVAVAGVGKILNIYWELIPATVIKCFLAKLVEDLAYDISSPAVREAVLRALQKMCDNHLCIPVLKNILPQLQNFVHDTSEKVRVAMFDLLLTVKGLRAIKFWHLVPLEHVLARLRVDSAPIVRRIMKLILTSFVPLNQTTAEQIQRCVTLIKLNQGAARIFFLNLPHYLSLEDAMQYMVTLCKMLIEGARKMKRQDESELSQAGDDSGLAVSEDLPESGRRDKTKKARKTVRQMADSVIKPIDESNHEDYNPRELESCEEDAQADIMVFCCLVEAVFLMHTVLLNKQDFKVGKVDKESLSKKLSVMVRELMPVSKDARLEEVLIALAAHLPSRGVPSVCHNLFKQLKEGSKFDEDRSKLIVKSLVLWGKADLVLDLARDSFKSALSPPEPASQSKGPTGASKKTVKFVTVENKISPEDACTLVQHVVSPVECRLILLSNHQSQLTSLVDSLKPVLQKISTYFEGNDGHKQNTAKMYVTLLKTLLRLTAFMCIKTCKKTSSDGEMEGDDVAKEVIAWCCQCVLPHLNQSSLDQQQLAQAILSEVVTFFTNILMIGSVPMAHLEAVAAFFTSIFRTQNAELSLKTNLLRCVYQLLQAIKCTALIANQPLLLENLICVSVDCLLTLLVKQTKNSEEDNGEVHSSEDSARNSSSSAFNATLSGICEILTNAACLKASAATGDQLAASIIEFFLSEFKCDAETQKKYGSHAMTFIVTCQNLDLIKRSFCQQLIKSLNSGSFTSICQLKAILGILDQFHFGSTDNSRSDVYLALKTCLNTLPAINNNDEDHGEVKRLIEEKYRHLSTLNVAVL